MSAINDTLLELQRSINALTGDVGALNGKVDSFLQRTVAHEGRTKDLEDRTGKVESRQHWYSGAGAVLGILIGKFAPGLFGH
jgi:hypothetical protein